MNRAAPRRFRNPLTDPDRMYLEQSRLLFGRPIPAPSAERVDALARALHRGDALADAWVATAATLPRAEAARMLECAVRDGIAAVNDAPPALVALFRALEHVPAWVDPRRLALGGRAFRRTGLLGFFVLSDFGLMGGYRSAAIARTLSLTGRLRDGTAERLIATGRFITRITEPGTLTRGADGYAAALHIRLVHAHVRALLARAGDWDVEEWGVPINQADMLGTNLLFSIGLVTGARKLGLRFTDEEVDAMVHLWRYIGYLVGVDDVLLPRDEVSAERALYLVGVTQPRADANSVALARALYELPLRFARSALRKKLVRGEMGLRVSFTRRMLGDAAADELGLPRSRMRHAVPAVVTTVRAAELLREYVPALDRAAYRMADAIVKAGQAAAAQKLAVSRG
ncbi:MAG: oxygenase MpaB family protein [Polyangiales bacterium]